MSDPHATSPSIDQLMRLAEVTADLQALLLLDSAWTAAERMSISTGGNTSGVAAIGDRVDRSLGDLEPGLAFLRGLFTTHRDWFDRQLEAAMDATQLDPSQQASIAPLLKGSHDSYAGNGVAVVDDLLARIPEERSNLNTKVTNIRNGGNVVTDLEERTVCGIATVMGMGALVGCVAFDALGLCLAGGADLLMVMHFCHHEPPTH
jgi:hypothetical protein